MSNLIDVGLHNGNAILYLAHHYGDGKIVVREAIQNALDKGAKNIFVRIDQCKRIIRIYDDGSGAGYDEISNKFGNIALSNKAGDKSAIGQKGIGNLAGMAIADQWKLITRDTKKPVDKPRLYQLDTQELSKSAGIQVHSEPYPGTLDGYTDFKAVTLLSLSGVNESAFRSLQNFEAVQKTIVDAFDTVLRQRKTKINVEYRKSDGKTQKFSIEPAPFRGARLDKVSISTKYGPVEFDLYFQAFPVTDPKILVEQGNTFNIALKPFVSLGDIADKYYKMWMKGHFEGVIHLDFCTVNPARSYFQKDAEFIVFMDALCEFSDTILQDLIDGFEESVREDKYRQVGEKVLKRIATLFKNNPALVPQDIKKRVLSGGILGQTVTSKPQEVRPRIEKDALVKQQQKRKEPKRKQEVKKLHQSEKDGLRILFVYPSEETGYNWYSRLENGAVEINTANKRFLEVERFGVPKLTEFVTLLVQKELSCMSMMPAKANEFSNNFEDTFINFWSLNLTLS